MATNNFNFDINSSIFDINNPNFDINNPEVQKFLSTDFSNAYPNGWVPLKTDISKIHNLDGKLWIQYGEPHRADPKNKNTIYWDPSLKGNKATKRDAYDPNAKYFSTRKLTSREKRDWETWRNLKEQRNTFINKQKELLNYKNSLKKEEEIFNDGSTVLDELVVTGYYNPKQQPEPETVIVPGSTASEDPFIEEYQTKFDTNPATKKAIDQQISRGYGSRAWGNLGLDMLEGAALATGFLFNPVGTTTALIGGKFGYDAFDEVWKNNHDGESWEESLQNLAKSYNVDQYIPDRFYSYANPGGWIGGAAGGKYGTFVKNNFSNLGRYTLDNLRPWSYTKKQIPYAAKGYVEALYKKPPTFFEHRPRWYQHALDKGMDPMAVEARFENGSIWAGIPEIEVPRQYFKRNANGTYSPTKTNPLAKGLVPDETDFYNRATKSYDVGKTIIAPDYWTPSGVGGEHSNFTLLGVESPQSYVPRDIVYVKYSDRQKLNPQWKLADFLKTKFNLTEGSPTYNLVDRLGGAEWPTRALGYKPFTIESIYKTNSHFIPEPVEPHELPFEFNQK